MRGRSCAQALLFQRDAVGEDIGAGGADVFSPALQQGRAALCLQKSVQSGPLQQPCLLAENFFRGLIHELNASLPVGGDDAFIQIVEHLVLREVRICKPLRAESQEYPP